MVIAAAIFTGPFPGAKCHGHFSNGYLSGSVNAQPGDEHLWAIVGSIPNELSVQLQESIVFAARRGSLRGRATTPWALRLKDALQLAAYDSG